MRLQTIYQAKTTEDAAVAATIIAQGIAEMRVGKWLVPDDDARLGTLAAVLDIYVQDAARTGFVDLLVEVEKDDCPGGGFGVAVWVDHTRPVPPPPDYEDRLWEVAGPQAGKWKVFGNLLNLTGHHHPGEPSGPPAPHHCLVFLAVEGGDDPGDTGAAALLERHHTLLDEHGVPAATKVLTPDRAQLYRAHGYIAQGTGAEFVGGSRLVPMLRHPAGAPR